MPAKKKTARKSLCMGCRRPTWFAYCDICVNSDTNNVTRSPVRWNREDVHLTYDAQNDRTCVIKVPRVKLH